MTREEKEAKSLFTDPKFARQAWQSVGRAILQHPATKAPEAVGPDGNLTIQSAIEQYSYDKLAQDIKNIGKENRAPTELEMILQCQIMRARFDTSAATFIRDTLGAKPIDESKQQMQVVNQYEELTDAELELIAEHRKALLQKGGNDADTKG